jgi:hypothetical protein
MHSWKQRIFPHFRHLFLFLDKPKEILLQASEKKVFFLSFLLFFVHFFCMFYSWETKKNMFIGYWDGRNEFMEQQTKRN